jgi:hypothetical protein
MWTVMQITAAEQMRGRVMGLYMATFGLSQIGGFIVGAVATVASLPVALAVAGSIVTLNAARSLRSIVRVAPAADRVRLETPPEPMHGG